MDWAGFKGKVEGNGADHSGHTAEWRSGPGGFEGPPEPGREARQGTHDVGMGEAGAVIQAGLLPGFTETIRGVVVSVHKAIERMMPDELSVEFGIEITARTGKIVSVLSEAGGTAHVNVTASWRRDGITAGLPEVVTQDD